MTNAFNNKIGASVEGDLVIETHTAYQVAVAGKIVVLQKDEWALRPGTAGNNIFDTMFGGTQ